MKAPRGLRSLLVTLWRRSNPDAAAFAPCPWCSESLAPCPVCLGQYLEVGCGECGLGGICPEHGRFWLS